MAADFTTITFTGKLWLQKQAASQRAPTAAAVLAVAASDGAPLPGPAHAALPVYVRDKIALDVTEQRASAAARALARSSPAGVVGLES